jgi:catechol-2,3-dioxygenase
VADGKELHHDTLYHLGMGVRSKDEVVQFYHSAVENGFHIEKPPRTTWRGTPLHEMWLKDPDGTLIEVYARLSKNELEQMPEDKEPWDLV